jgi:hypothetical protein
MEALWQNRRCRSAAAQFLPRLGRRRRIVRRGGIAAAAPGNRRRPFALVLLRAADRAAALREQRADRDGDHTADRDQGGESSGDT